MAKTMDARQKLEKIRNLKEGKLEVKKLGGITLTKRAGGAIVLTTNKGAAAPTKLTPEVRTSQDQVPRSGFL
jgi:hypothetical protein